MTFASRHALLTPLLGLALLLAACSTPPPPPPPAPAPPPPPPPIPSVLLSPRIIEQAGAYADYVAKAAAITADFTSPEQVASALTQGEAYDAQQLRRDAVAYAAVLALQDGAFVAGVRMFVSDPDQRRQVMTELYNDPAYAVGFKGSDSAAGRIIAKIGDAGTQIYTGGKAVKQSAYDIQHQAWSKTDVSDRDGRLARAKSNSAAQMMSSLNQVNQLQSAAGGVAPPDGIAYSVSPPYTPLVIRGLAVAALAALGEAGDNNYSSTQLIMAEPGTDTCLNLAKLNLYQCLAVARPNYEDVFCLGQHILMDTGQCLIKASGAAMPIEPPPPPPPAVKVAVKKKAPAKRPAAKKPVAAAAAPKH